MKISMTNFSLIEALQLLNKFSFVTGKLGYAIARTKSRMLSELKPFEEERLKLIEKYGEQDENGTYTVNQDSENFSDYARDITAIADETIEIDFHQISQDEFDATDIYNDNCSTRDYEVLEQLFVKKDVEEEETK